MGFIDDGNYYDIHSKLLGLIRCALGMAIVHVHCSNIAQSYKPFSNQIWSCTYTANDTGFLCSVSGIFLEP